MKDELIVFVRIALYALSGRAVAGGWLPQDVADQLAGPEAVEAITGVLIGACALAWYWLSKARARLRGESS